MPIPFFAFREMYEELARMEWRDVGELPPFALVSEALILSALAQPFASVGGEDLYPSVPAKAAVLFRGLVKNHGLKDGNKRLAVTSLSVFLLANGWEPRYGNLQLYRYALRVARKEGAYPVDAIQRWVRRNVVLMPDRALNELRKQNRQYGSAEALERAFEPVLAERGAFRRALEEVNAEERRAKRRERRRRAREQEA